jgi:hypothetical protein
LEPSSANDILEQRLALLSSLAASLEQARQSILQPNLENLKRETARQQEVCARLQTLPAAIRPWPSLPAAERTVRLKQEIQQAEIQIAHLNVAYNALLKRARRTVDIFCRVLASALTYSPPPSAVRPASQIRR